MANPEHLKILKKGVKTWNKWRKENGDIEPALSGADLRGVNLRKADLSEAKIVTANLSNADLTEANLGKADVSKANLSYANLSKANLSYTDLSKADLSYANLTGANLNKAVLPRAKLVSAKLMQADLSMAKIQVALFFDSNLQNANLRHADLRHSNLCRINLSGAILTAAKLYGTSRDDWIIKNIECEYVYWDWEGKQRSPRERDLESGEFERLYEALPIIEYIFRNGMSPIDPLIMDRVVQIIRERRPEFDIKIDSVNARGIAPSIKFTVQHEEHQEPALDEVQKEYNERLNRLEAEKDRLYALLGQAIDEAGTKLITAGPGAIVATDGSTINIQQHIHNALELQKAIADEPEESESFAKIAKKTALDIIGDAMKDIAKGQVKEAAKLIIKLGKDLGPIIARTAAYAFFRSIGG